MIKLSDGYPKEFKKIINIALDEIFCFFMEVGSNLHYEEIYATVFPLHKQNDYEFGMNMLRKLHRNIQDDFTHKLTSLDEYILYHILYFVFDSSEDGFNLDEIISTHLTEDVVKKLESQDPDAVKVLNATRTPYDLSGIIFEDIDFLTVGWIFEVYRENPEIVTDFLYIDLEYYKELMPEDIIAEYEEIKQSVIDVSSKKLDGDLSDTFKNTIINTVKVFKFWIEHKKVHVLLNTPNGVTSEKEVQRLFHMVAELYLENTNVVVNAEVDTGRGYVDFYFSEGKKHKALVELKLSNHKRYKDGINYQLPTYLKAENVEFGVLVLICYTEEKYNKSHELYKTAIELSNEYDIDIKFERVNASGTYIPASNIKNKSEIGFDD